MTSSECGDAFDRGAPKRRMRERKRRKRKPSLWNYPATYLLVGVNHTGVCGDVSGLSPAVPGDDSHTMCGLGVLTAQFDGDTLLRFGASFCCWC